MSITIAVTVSVAVAIAVAMSFMVAVAMSFMVAVTMSVMGAVAIAVAIAITRILVIRQLVIFYLEEFSITLYQSNKTFNVDETFANGYFQVLTIKSFKDYFRNGDDTSKLFIRKETVGCDICLERNLVILQCVCINIKNVY